MADKEMYDYLGAVVPDYATTTLAVAPQKIVSEMGRRNQVVHEMDDGSQEVVTLDSDPYFVVSLEWPTKTSVDAGTILDFYMDSAKANGVAKSFKWDHPTDGHTYVVYFMGDITRTIRCADVQGIPSMKLKVIGRIND